MKSLRFHDIGLVGADMTKGREFLESTFDLDRVTEVFEDPGIGVYVQFGRTEGGSCYELIAPLGESSPVATALKWGINILNHVACLIDDLDRDAAMLQEKGSMMAGAPKPAVAYGGAGVQFWIIAQRSMVELIEAPQHEHAYRVNG